MAIIMGDGACAFSISGKDSMEKSCVLSECKLFVHDLDIPVNIFCRGQVNSKPFCQLLYLFCHVWKPNSTALSTEAASQVPLSLQYKEQEK